MPASSRGFSVEWYGKALSNAFLMEALENSLIVGLTSAALATLFGTMAALGLERVTPKLRAVFDALFAAGHRRARRGDRHRDTGGAGRVFGLANALIASLWPGDQPPRLALGFGSIIAAHGPVHPWRW